MHDCDIDLDAFVSQHVHDGWQYFGVLVKVGESMQVICPVDTDDFEELRFVADVMGFEVGKLLLNNLLIYRFREHSDKLLLV